MPILEKGRPADCAGRMKKEADTYDLLDRLGIEYERIDHEPMFTIDACREIDELLGLEICKNLLLTNSQKTDFYLYMIPGGKRFDTKAVSRELGTARLSFAPGEYMEELLNITPGSLTVLGLMNDPGHRVRLLIDREVARGEFFAAHPCVNTSSLKLRMSDLTGLFLPYTGHVPTLIG